MDLLFLVKLSRTPSNMTWLPWCHCNEHTDWWQLATGKRHRCFNITAFLLVLNDFIDVLCISLLKASLTFFMEEIHWVYILTCPLKLDVYAFDPTALHDIQIFFSTSTFGLWCRGISLKDKVLVTGAEEEVFDIWTDHSQDYQGSFQQMSELAEKMI